MTASQDMLVRIIEVYASIQGESTWAGCPCVFVRFARCNLRCIWCDTTYSFYGGEPRALDDVVQQALQYGIPLVEVTGGEPLAQKGCVPLCAKLLDAGLTVLIETSGSLPIWSLPPEVIKIMDIKCPGSGMVHRNLWENIAHLNPQQDEVKFVIADRADYDWSKSVLEAYNLVSRCKTVLFSPVFSSLTPRQLCEWILADRLPVRFQLQLHKYIWPPEARGV